MRRLSVLFSVFMFVQGFAQQATFDLSGYKFGEGETVFLNSEWEFYYNQLYYPEDFKNPALAPKPDSLIKPQSWNNITLNGKPCDNHGYATYRLILVNMPYRESLMLNLFSVQTSSRVFINGNEVSHVGKVGTTYDTTEPMTRDVQVMVPDNAGTVEIILQVANFHHRKGGYEHPFEIGNPDTILKKQTLLYTLDAAESAALAIIGFFLLAMYIFRRKDLSILYFSLFSISLSLRPVISVNYLLADLFRGLNWSFMIKLEYLGMFMSSLFMVLFIRKLFPQQLPLWVTRFFVIILIVQIAVIVFFPPAVFSWLVLPMLILIPLAVLTMTVTIIRAAIARVEGADYAGMGVIVLFVSLLLKVMTYAEIIPPLHVLITILDIGFIFTMSLILGSRFSKQFVKVETLQIETERQRTELDLKKQQIEQQKEIVEEKNKEILDSIAYAKRIQAAILPSARVINEALPDHFIFYQPKDIVAGDFYWLEKRDGKILVAAADCTGHGVPGAMVSVICNNGLNRSVREHGLTDPGKILDKTREIILAEFEKSDEEVKDGMDISLCSISPDTLSLSWAGANNPLWILRAEWNEIEEIRPNKQPIGKFAENKPFTTHEVSLKKGDVIYLFTDGYADQFGGEKNKKFKYSRLKELLLEINKEPLAVQADILNRRFKSWKGEMEQTDDICVVGIRI